MKPGSALLSQSRAGHPLPGPAGSAALAVALALAGCSTAIETGSLGLGTLKVAPPSIPLPQVDVAALANATPATPSLSPVPVQETYIRIARGANACWFGGRGIYRDAYIFYADADSSATGGTADITIHERDKLGERPWGLKALRIRLQPVDGQTDVSITNLKMPDADVARMSADVARWIQGREECSTPPVSTTAAAPAADAAAATAPVAAAKPKR